MDIIQKLRAIWVSLTSQKWTVRPSCWYFASCWQLVLCPKQRPFTARTRTIMERDHWSVCYIVFFSKFFKSPNFPVYGLQQCSQLEISLNFFMKQPALAGLLVTFMGLELNQIGIDEWPFSLKSG